MNKEVLRVNECKLVKELKALEKTGHVVVTIEEGKVVYRFTSLGVIDLLVPMLGINAQESDAAMLEDILEETNTTLLSKPLN